MVSKKLPLSSTSRDKTANFISCSAALLVCPHKLLSWGELRGVWSVLCAKWSDNEEKRRSTDGSVGRRCTLGRGGGDTPSTWGAVMQDLEVSGPAQQTHTLPFSDLLASLPSIWQYPTATSWEEAFKVLKLFFYKILELHVREIPKSANNFNMLQVALKLVFFVYLINSKKRQWVVKKMWRKHPQI